MPPFDKIRPMTKHILFIASLHHPETLVAEQALAKRENRALPIFPTSSAQNFMVRVLQEAGYVCDVFWRNLRHNNPQNAKTFVYKEGITLDKVLIALKNRLPYRINPQLLARNAELLAYARQFKPDVLWLVGDNTVIAPETLATLKQELGCTLIYASGTSPIVFSKPIERKAARLYDWVLVNDYYHGIQWQELGAKNMLCLPIAAIDPIFHQPRPLNDAQRQAYACEASFVGTLIPPNLYSERIQALESLTHVDLGIWTIHDLPKALKPFYKGKALADEMMNILSASPITLNIHGDFMRYGGNMRLFEAAGVGAFQICDNRAGIHEWFTVGEHVAMYHSLEELREQVAYYTAHPKERRDMAEASREHALKHHTYAHRLQRLQAEGVL